MSILDENEDLFELPVNTELYEALSELGSPRIVACGNFNLCNECIGHKYNIANGCPVCSAPMACTPEMDNQDLIIVRCGSCGHYISVCGEGDIDGISIPDWRTTAHGDTI